MRTWLVAAAVLWPAILSAAAIERIRHEAPAFTTAVYLAASRVCHQRPERSFQTHGVTWPVCGRCSGLYLSAALGALAAGVAMRRRPSLASGRLRLALVVAALPTLLTLVAEWSGVMTVTNLARALAALPLGAAVAWAVIAVAPGSSEPIR